MDKLGLAAAGSHATTLFMNDDAPDTDVELDEDPRQEAARSFVAQAERGIRDELETELPERPFATGIVSFLFDAEAAVRWLVLSITGYFVQLLLVYTIYFWKSEGIFQVAAVLLWTLLLFVGLAYCVLASACCVAIVVDTSNGLSKIRNWPDLNFTEWALDSFYVINSSFAAFMPGCLAGQLVVCGGAPTWSALVAGGVSLFFLFPPMVLASIESGSAIWPADRNVWYSLRSHRKTWKKFYLIALALVGGGLAAHLLMWTGSMYLGAVGAAGTVTITMIYFRLLGRLSRIIDHDPEEVEKRKEPAASPPDK